MYIVAYTGVRMRKVISMVIMGIFTMFMVGFIIALMG